MVYSIKRLNSSNVKVFCVRVHVQMDLLARYLVVGNFQDTHCYAPQQNVPITESFVIRLPCSLWLVACYGQFTWSWKDGDLRQLCVRANANIEMIWRVGWEGWGINLKIASEKIAVALTLLSKNDDASYCSVYFSHFHPNNPRNPSVQSPHSFLGGEQLMFDISNFNSSLQGLPNKLLYLSLVFFI